MGNHSEEILAAIAHEMGYMLSYAVYNPGQYIFSRYCVEADTPSNLWYCAVRVRGSILTLVLVGEQYHQLELNEPESIAELESYLKVKENWYVPGREQHRAEDPHPPPLPGDPRRPPGVDGRLMTRPRSHHPPRHRGGDRNASRPSPC